MSPQRSLSWRVRCTPGGDQLARVGLLRYLGVEPGGVGLLLDEVAEG